ncbi:MAG: MmcQ/YjbR family DNA-binding protein [Gemmatimonadaceae bacterium]
MARRYAGMEEATSYGTPALKIKGKFFARMWEDGETLVIRTTFEDRDHLLATWPKEFFLTDHYLEHPTVLVHLTSVDRERLAQLLEDGWRRMAPPRLRNELDAARPAPSARAKKPTTPTKRTR